MKTLLGVFAALALVVGIASAQAPPVSGPTTFAFTTSGQSHTWTCPNGQSSFQLFIPAGMVGTFTVSTSQTTTAPSPWPSPPNSFAPGASSYVNTITNSGSLTVSLGSNYYVTVADTAYVSGNATAVGSCSASIATRPAQATATPGPALPLTVANGGTGTASPNPTVTATACAGSASYIGSFPSQILSIPQCGATPVLSGITLTATPYPLTLANNDPNILIDTVGGPGASSSLFIDSGSDALGLANLIVSGNVEAFGSGRFGVGNGPTTPSGDVSASRSSTTGAFELGGSLSSVTCDLGVTTFAVLTCNQPFTTTGAFKATTGGFTSSVSAGSATQATLTAGDIGASRSTTTGAVFIGGSSTSARCDWGITTSSVLTCNQPFTTTGALVAASSAITGAETNASLNINSTGVATTLFPYAITQFTSSGTFTSASNSTTATIYKYTICAGGGGGGGANGTAAAGGGGGSGACGIGTFTGLAASTGMAVTVGTGGAAGSTAGGTGGTGNTSVLASPGSVTCNAGLGGVGSTGTTSAAVLGGAGGATATGCTFVGTVGARGLGYVGAMNAGQGASTMFGGGGVGGNITNTGGGAGISPGTGGGGGVGSGVAGGAGAPGIVLIERMTP